MLLKDVARGVGSVLVHNQLFAPHGEPQLYHYIITYKNHHHVQEPASRTGTIYSRTNMEITKVRV